MADASKKNQKESEWWVEEQKEARGDKAEKPVVAAGSSFFTTVEDYDQVAAEKNLTDLNQKLLSEGGSAAGEWGYLALLESRSSERDIDKIKIPREYPEGMVPLQQRPASSEEVANAILFLASNDASYVTGTEIYVDGALSLFQG